MRQSPRPPRIIAFGDCALLVTFTETNASPANARAARLAEAVRGLPGVRSVTPASGTTLIVVDPARLPLDQARRIVRRRMQGLARGLDGPMGRDRAIPVIYGGAFGPDLEAVAALTGLSQDAVVAAHSGVPYTVLFLGFAPGFPYLGDLPERLSLPRLATPRARVPAGSVAIAGRQTGVYPQESPGGWRILGRTPIRLFDPHREPPAYLAPGDRVTFRPITARDAETTAPIPADW